MALPDLIAWRSAEPFSRHPGDIIALVKRYRLHIQILPFVAAVIITMPCSSSNLVYQGSSADRDAIRRTGDAIRAAFARGDLDTIMAYHHPNVIKALAANKYLIGNSAVRTDLLRTFHEFTLHFDESRVESIFFQGDTAVEESAFVINGLPKNKGQPFLLKGRSMVVYVRYKNSPTGWASIREIIQPAP